MKTEAEVDGQCKYGLQREGTVGGGDTKPAGVEATCQTDRYIDHICVGTSRNESCVRISTAAENGLIVIQTKISHYHFFPQTPSLTCWSSVGSCHILLQKSVFEAIWQSSS